MRKRRREREELMDTLSCRLREARARAGLTQVEVAAAVNVREDVYARYERGTAVPGVSTFERLCEVVDCSADWLLDQGGRMPRPGRERDDKNAEHARRLRRINRQVRRASPETVSLVNVLLDRLTGLDRP